MVAATAAGAPGTSLVAGFAGVEAADDVALVDPDNESPSIIAIVLESLSSRKGKCAKRRTKHTLSI